MLNDSIGYLRVNAFNSYAKGGYLEELHALEAALDAGFRDSEKLRGLVIDVRRNSGGADPLGIEIASRLTGTKYLAYSKVTRNNIDGPLHFTEPQESWVSPSPRPGFRGPVVLLTGPDTISAGETFTMALMARGPHVTRIGQNTQGVFSDVLGRRLPNGWQFGLPNEVYLTKDGKAFDGPGIPPDLRVPFSKADLVGGKDAALDKALELLQAGVPPAHDF
jgi:C-terminal processing protease CtpA/Prc